MRILWKDEDIYNKMTFIYSFIYNKVIYNMRLFIIKVTFALNSNFIIT